MFHATYKQHPNETKKSKEIRWGGEHHFGICPYGDWNCDCMACQHNHPERFRFTIHLPSLSELATDQESAEEQTSDTIAKKESCPNNA